MRSLVNFLATNKELGANIALVAVNKFRIGFIGIDEVKFLYFPAT
jgi:hypothetical protein